MNYIDKAVEFLKREESFLDHAVWDVNAWRGGYGSSTVTYPDGSVDDVTQFTMFTREGAERDLYRRLEDEFPSYVVRDIGRGFYDLPLNTKVAILSIAYNYGRVPSYIVPYVFGDRETLAQKVSELRSNPSRREREAAYILSEYQGVLGLNPGYWIIGLFLLFLVWIYDFSDILPVKKKVKK